MSDFARRLIRWQKRHGRHDLPWQGTGDPYRVWLSEIMLQQTQVATVIPYYARFLERFPTLADLAAAPVDQVMEAWSGLGYYARARNLHRCAGEVMARHGGHFPHSPEALAALPGIGRSTANAIAAFCFGAQVPILDGNVKRVLCRFLGIEGFPGSAATEIRLWQSAAELLPARDIPSYIQGQMDLGATICTSNRPRCAACPVSGSCVAWRDGRIAELPTPRPRKVLPEREVTLLVLRHDHRIGFERRPPTGIWGGLLSLPELATDGHNVAAYVRQRFGAELLGTAPGPEATHTFTHFRLRIRPLLCELGQPLKSAAGEMAWLDKAERARAALPAPIRELLSAFP